MDVRKTEPRGTAVLQKTTEENVRPPLVPSEKVQKNNVNSVARKPRTREVTSRYKSVIAPVTPSPPSNPATAQRWPSPNVRRVALSPPPSLPKRSQSAERRRPTTPSMTLATSSSSAASTMSSPSSRPSTPVHDVAADMQRSSRRLGGSRIPDGLWPSVRSLSASFQSESVSVSFTKRDKLVSNSSLTPGQMLKTSVGMQTDRKRTPSSGKNASDQSENLKPVENLHARVPDKQRWPSLKHGKFSATDMSRSVDLTDRASRSGTLQVLSRGISPTRRANISDGVGRGLQKTLGEVTRLTTLDGSGGPDRESGLITSVPVHPSERASLLTCPSRTVSLPLAGSPCSSSPIKTSVRSASSRTLASPSRTRPSTPSSPSKNSLPSASSRGMVSPFCTRPSTPSSSVAGQTGNSSSILGYIVDVRKGKKNASHIEPAHRLRLLYNRHLQWCFVNARADAAMFIQKMTTEGILYSVWATMSEMRDSVFLKRFTMQHVRQEMKLALILKEQMAYLEDWAQLEREHCSSLLGAFEALKASTLRLPVTGGTRADIHDLKDAISSAVDIMQAMASSIYTLSSRVEGTTSVVCELAGVAAGERAMLNECQELLASTAAMQVQECSLRTQLLQLRQDVITAGRQSRQ